MEGTKMGKVSLAALASLVIGGGIWIWVSQPDLLDTISQYVENGEVLTLEAKFSPDLIKSSHQQELLRSDQHSYGEPILKFHPYLLLEVKYTQPDRKTKEGVILWSLEDGEMVLNTDSWEKTHGFEDSILADADRTDFKILNALAKGRGSLTLDELQKSLQQEKNIIEPWIEKAKRKHLIVQKGNILYLHFQNPKILVTPETKMTQWLVSKPYSQIQKISPRYRKKQIQHIAEMAFGEDFAVRNMREVYLPVYMIPIQNPDGSIFMSYWNALNGQKIQPKFMHPLS